MIEEEETESEWEEDVDAVIEEAINKITRIEKAKRNLREVIASITAEQPATTTPTPAIVKTIPSKSFVSTPRASNKRKWAQPSRYIVAMRAPKGLE